MPDRTIRVLVVEDQDHLAQTFVRLLRRELGDLAQIERAESLAKAMQLVAQVNFDAFVVDHHLEDGTGIELLATARNEGIQAPFILVTGEEGSSTLEQARQAGVAEVLVKGHISASDLARAVRQAVSSG